MKMKCRLIHPGPKSKIHMGPRKQWVVSGRGRPLASNEYRINKDLTRRLNLWIKLRASTLLSIQILTPKSTQHLVSPKQQQKGLLVKSFLVKIQGCSMNGKLGVPKQVKRVRRLKKYHRNPNASTSQYISIPSMSSRSSKSRNQQHPSVAQNTVYNRRRRREPRLQRHASRSHQ